MICVILQAGFVDGAHGCLRPGGCMEVSQVGVILVYIIDNINI